MLIILFAVVSVIASPASAFNLDHSHLIGSNLPSVQAKKFIKELNLFPKEDVNVIEGRESPLLAGTEKKLVEKRIKFPNLEVPDGFSVDDLGHHAGYYKIANSYDARYLPFFFFFSLINYYCFINIKVQT